MKTCLLVEDSTTQRNIMKKLAESCGLEVIEANDGLQGIELCENSIPDLIILDMNMPNMGGLDFLKALSEMPKDFSPHIIVCSSTVNTDDIVKAVKFGADEYHCKSINIDNLRQKIMQTPGLE